MNERLSAVNRDLRILDDAHRLGQIARDDYRLRRRNVLARLSDAVVTEQRSASASPAGAGRSTTTTATRPVSRVQPAQVPVGAVAMPPLATQAGETRNLLSAWPGLALLVLALAVASAATLLAFHHPGAHRVAAAVPAASAAPVGNPASDLESRLQGFVDADRWDATTVHAMLEAWQSATPDSRAAARDSASFSALRDAVTHQQQVVSLLREGHEDDAARAQRAAALEQLGRALATP